MPKPAPWTLPVPAPTMYGNFITIGNPPLPPRYRMVYDLDDPRQFEAITSLRLCYGRPEYRLLFSSIILHVGSRRTAINKHELLCDLVPSEKETSLVIFPTRMPLLIAYLRECIVQLEVYVCEVPHDFNLTLMVSRAKLKSAWERPVTCYYPVLRELGMCFGRIVGMALRVPFRKARKVTHVRLTPFRSIVPVDIDMKWMRPHQHDFPMSFDLDKFIIIPPLSMRSLPPTFRRCGDRFSVSYKYEDDPMYWYEMADGYGGYYLSAEMWHFMDGKEMRLLY